MAKKTEQTKETKHSESTIKKEQIVAEKRTFCYLASKADHIVEVQYNGQIAYIQPFGKIKVIKEQVKINSDDARYLTFIKI